MQSELHIPIFNFPSPLYEKLMRHFWHMDNFQLDTFKEIFSFYSNQKVPLLIHESPSPFLQKIISSYHPTTHCDIKKTRINLKNYKENYFCLGINKLDTVSCSKEIYDPCEKN